MLRGPRSARAMWGAAEGGSTQEMYKRGLPFELGRLEVLESYRSLRRSELPLKKERKYPSGLPRFDHLILFTGWALAVAALRSSAFCNGRSRSGV